MNMNDIEYKVLSGIEQIGSDGVLGIKVMIGGTNLPDFKDDRFKEIGWKAREAVDALIQEIDAARAQMNPEAIERAKTEKEKILACFRHRSLWKKSQTGTARAGAAATCRGSSSRHRLDASRSAGASRSSISTGRKPSALIRPIRYSSMRM